MKKTNALPQVSVLIPTYNRPHYFSEALQSALAQTYGNMEIIIGDDSTDDRTKEIVQPYLARDSRISYYRNRPKLGQFDNDLRLLSLAQGEYINFLMDDDRFHPQKVEKMMNYFLMDDDRQIKLVTSARQVIDGAGRVIPRYSLSTQRLFDRDMVVNGISFADFLLCSLTNFIGEPTTVLFRKADLHEPFGTFAGRKSQCNVDVATWLNLLKNGNMVYIAHPLSSFRIHDGQQLHQPEKSLQGVSDFAHAILEGRKIGFLREETKYRLAVEACIRYVKAMLDLASDKPIPDTYVKETEEYLRRLNAALK